MNNVILSGRLVADPEIRYTNDNLAIATFTLAVDRGKKGETDFPRCQAFGKTAELIEKYTAKGLRVAIQGSIKTGSYTNRNGEKVYTTDVSVFKAEFLDWKQNNAQNENQSVSGGMGFEAIDDEDLPF